MAKFKFQLSQLWYLALLLLGFLWRRKVDIKKLKNNVDSNDNHDTIGEQ